MEIVTRENAENLEKMWQSPSGIPGRLAIVNNQVIGKRFMITAFAYFLIAGVMALLMRVQLAVPQNTFLDPEMYNAFFTMHGSTMMYLFAVPFLEGLAIYLLPLMLGSRDLAFPRLSAFGYWTYLFGGLMFYASFVVGAVPTAGWFAYTPLSGPGFSELGVDFWLLGLSLVEIGGITAGLEIVVTVLKLRAPGMSINRMPLFAWAMLAVGMMILFAFTTLLVATVLLELDRSSLSTRFFDPDHGGSTLLWQHLFWFFGHPEVYIIFLPATGIVSMVVATFSGRILGYILIAVAIVVTAFVSFGLWVHHMYTTGLPELSSSFFAAASLMITLASGTQVFAWIASLWGRRPAMKTPLLFVLGFLFLFVLGGLTGVMIAVVPFDWQVHDSFFIVAHFHYVLIGGAVFPMFAGLYYWMPKITGRTFSEAIGKWSFWLAFIGFNVAFFPMHIMGFFGMPRRVYTYSSELGLDVHNMVATIGSFILGLGFFLFVVDLFLSIRYGKKADANPWGGDSLEWSVESPPPIYNFYRPPVVHSRHPLWEQSPQEGHASAERASAALSGAPKNWRATLATDALAGEPQAIQYLPGPAYSPLWVALGLLVASVGVLVKYYLLLPLGLIVSAGALIYWLWTPGKVLEMLHGSDISEEAGLPIFTTGSRSVAWWGLVGLITILATVLAALLYSYFYIRLYSAMWPQDGLPLPGWRWWPLLAYALLAASAVPYIGAMYGFRRGRENWTKAGLIVSLLMGTAFLGFQFYAISRLGFAPRTNAYGSLFYVISWFVALLVLLGLALTVAALIRLRQKHGGGDAFVTLHVQIAALFWYFTVAAGLLVFLVLYLSPYVI